MRKHVLLPWTTLGLLCVPTPPALATTKGLNQIVTPDVQSVGVLSVSVQQVDPNIADRCEGQSEIGLTGNRRLD